MDVNKNIIDNFKLLLNQIQVDIDFSSGKTQQKNSFRLRSIAKAIKQLEKYDKKITSSEQVKHIEGIGKGSLKRIDEILKTGNLSEIKITPDVEKYLNFIESLQDVINIGRKKAYDLFKNHNITSVKELKEKYKNGSLDLPNNIIKGLKYVDKIKEQIPREDIDYLDEIMSKITLEISPKLFGTTCGSYRRGNKTSNDIDYIITHTDLITKKDVLKHNYLEDFVKALKKKKIIVDSLTGDDVPTKYMGICKIKGILRRIDIRYIPYESYYSALLYFTGSKSTNQKMRQVAIINGYLLNEYGLFDENNKMIHVNSEKDIFDHLGMEYLSPDQR
jgi:DNA polymerase beta